MLSKRQVNSELFLMGKEGQPAADACGEPLAQKRAESEEILAHNDVLRSSREVPGT